MRAPPPSGPLIAKSGPGNRCLLKSSRHSIPNLRIRKPIPSSQAIATLDQPAGIARLDERETRAEDETASQKDHGVDRSDREIGLPRARVESRLIPIAGIDPSQEKGAKEQHLGRQKQPHPGNCRLLLVACA